MQDGFALLIVMWVLVILSVLMIGFGRRAALERQMAWYAMDEEQSEQAARGAVIRAVQELANRNAVDEFNGQKGYTGLDQEWADVRDMKTDQDMFRYLQDPNFKADRCTVVIEDCESRFSVNQAQREIFDELDFLDFKQVRTILDRRDTDGGRHAPYDFASLADFRESLHIPEEDWNGDSDHAGAKALFTTWGTPGGQVNINTASAEVLRAIPDMDEALVDELVAYRNGPDGVPRTADDVSFRSIDEVAKVLHPEPNVLAALSRYGKTDSAYFTIRAHATRRRGKVNVSCTAVVRYLGVAPQILYWNESSDGA
jgi:hypothetical protein